MKKIKDEKLFKEQMTTIVMAIVMIIITILVGTYLKVNGIDSFFTTNVYETAFEQNPQDIVLINRLEMIAIIAIIFMLPKELKFNKEMREIEKEEKELCGYLLEH